MKFAQKLVVLSFERYQKLLLHQEKSAPSSDQSPSYIEPEVIHRASGEASIEASGGHCENQTGSGLGMSVDNIVEFLPKTMKSRGKSILHHLQTSAIKEFGLSSKGELIYKGQTIQNSHIVDLLKDGLHRFSHSSPIGVKEWYIILANSNIPESLILNPERQKQMRFIKEHPDQAYLPPPPGEPVKKSVSRNKVKRLKRLKRSTIAHKHWVKF